MKEVYTLLKRIEVRPGMWTGEYSLKSIKTFIDGYSLALHDNSLLSEEENKHDNFNDWIANKLGFNDSVSGWVNMIVNHVSECSNTINVFNSDTIITKELHEKSIRKFYLLLDEFYLST